MVVTLYYCSDKSLFCQQAKPVVLCYIRPYTHLSDPEFCHNWHNQFVHDHQLLKSEQVTLEKPRWVASFCHRRNAVSAVHTIAAEKAVLHKKRKVFVPF